MTLVKTFSLLAALALSALACTALPSFAAPVVWQLRDIKFNDGGSASGSFSYDATLGKVLDWSIVATGHGADTFRAPIDIPFVNVPGCTGPACDTAQRFFKPLPAQDDFVFIHGLTPGSGGSLNLFSARPLTDERGIVSLTTGTDLGGSSLSCCETGVPTKLVSGFLDSAPEPATMFCMLAGIAGIAGIQWARRRSLGHTSGSQRPR